MRLARYLEDTRRVRSREPAAADPNRASTSVDDCSTRWRRQERLTKTPACLGICRLEDGGGREFVMLSRRLDGPSRALLSCERSRYNIRAWGCAPTGRFSVSTETPRGGRP